MKEFPKQKDGTMARFCQMRINRVIIGYELLKSKKWRI